MKKIIMVMALMLSVLSYAQESFPAKHPELLLNKNVKVVHNNMSAKFGFENFYADPELSGGYKRADKYTSYTKVEELLGRKFKVTAVEDVMIGYNKTIPAVRVTLESPEGEKIYYKYDKEMYDFDYVFEVEGGLTLPAGFYCELVKKSQYDDSEFTARIAMGTTLTKHASGAETTYTMTFMLFGPKNYDEVRSVILVLENGKSIVDNDQFFFPAVHDENAAKYTFTVVLEPKEAKMLMQNKLLSIKAGKLVLPFSQGEKLSGILKCMEPLK